MAVSVRHEQDPRRVLTVAEPFLESDPVQHNLILTLLHRCAALGATGRFWLAEQGVDVVGVVFQWPTHFFATVTPMPPAVVDTVVDAIVDAGMELPGVNGEVTTSARFAGRWTERTRGSASATDPSRLYALDRVVPPPIPSSGVARRVEDADRDLVVDWFAAFGVETGEALASDPSAVLRRIGAGELSVWDDDGPVAVAGCSTPVAAATRIGPVYTPPDRRGRGYASALVGALAGSAQDAGLGCLLYTQLENATSNAIYRAIGFRAVAEILRYEFAAAP